MTVPGVQRAPEMEEPPIAPTVVEDVLKVFDKAIRAHQLYLHNNPTYLKALENARKAFEPLWQELDQLTMQVTDTQLVWYGVAVHSQPDKGGDSLPWLLFKDGLRELTLLPGFEREELERFLALIPRVRRAQAHEDDLLTLLWEQGFGTVRYRYVEPGDAAAPLEAGEDPGRWESSHQPVRPLTEAIEEAKAEQEEAAEGGGEEAREAPTGRVRMEDFDSTLYFLDANEVAYLKQETDREYALDLRRQVVATLLDIFELQVDPLVRSEVAGDLESLVLHLLSAGQFGTVAYLLREVEGTMQRARELKPGDRDRLGRLPDRLSQPEALAQMLQALEEAPTLPSGEELAQLFTQLKPTALGVVLDFLPRVRQAGLRPLLEGAADRLARSHTAHLVELIADRSAAVSREAIRRAGALRTAAAVPSLAAIVTGSPDRETRAAAVAALAEIGSAGALAALEPALEDEDREIRIATERALAAQAHRPALVRVQALVTGKAARDADRTERIALFELYGSICGDAGIPVLDQFLGAKGGLFARKEDPELRACAAIALGRIGSPAARKALEAYVGEKDLIVKAAVSRALRGGGAG